MSPKSKALERIREIREMATEAIGAIEAIDSDNQAVVDTAQLAKDSNYVVSLEQNLTATAKLLTVLHALNSHKDEKHDPSACAYCFAISEALRVLGILYPPEPQ